MISLNDREINIKKFPNGESLINTEDLNISEEINIIKLKFESDNDITHLIFLKGHLDELKARCNLIIAYMPYSWMH